MVNQLEVHVFQQQKVARPILKKYGAQLMAWSPLTQGKNGLFTNPVLTEIGKKYGKTEEIFQLQSERCGVEYFAYYLLHNVNSMRYQQIIRETHMFDYKKKWKEAGKVKHIAFSFRDTADVLDQIRTERPEVGAVQIAVNCFDWNAYLVQSKACYDMIREHDKQVIVMEPVKGGMLAKAPDTVRKLLQVEHPDWSPAAWSLRWQSGRSAGGSVRYVYTGAGGRKCGYHAKHSVLEKTGTGGLGRGFPSVPGNWPCWDCGFYPDGNKDQFAFWKHNNSRCSE